MHSWPSVLILLDFASLPWALRTKIDFYYRAITQYACLLFPRHSGIPQVDLNRT